MRKRKRKSRQRRRPSNKKRKRNRKTGSIGFLRNPYVFVSIRAGRLSCRDSNRGQPVSHGWLSRAHAPHVTQPAQRCFAIWSGNTPMKSRSRAPEPVFSIWPSLWPGHLAPTDFRFVYPHGSTYRSARFANATDGFREKIRRSNNYHEKSVRPPYPQ